MTTIRSKVAEIVATRSAALKRQDGAVASTLLDVLLRPSDVSENHLTDEEVTNQVMTFMVAGHETTSNALCWAFYLLAQHPDVEAKLRAEVVRRAEAHGGNSTAQTGCR